MADDGRAFPRPARKVPTFSLQTANIEGATARSRLVGRALRRPPEGEEREGPAPLLMVPSMEKQAAELES
jgi:hypothetical protein